jgi:hypothetical protein
MVFWRRTPPPPVPGAIAAVSPGLYRVKHDSQQGVHVGYLMLIPHYGGVWEPFWLFQRKVGSIYRIHWHLDFGDFDTELLFPLWQVSQGSDCGWPMSIDDCAEVAGGKFGLHGVGLDIDRVDPLVEPEVWREHYVEHPFNQA